MKLVFCVPPHPSKTEEQVCFEIPFYEEIREFPPKPPFPDPRGFEDWRMLATIGVLAERLSGDLGREIVEIVGLKVAEIDRDLGSRASLTRQASTG